MIHLAIVEDNDATAQLLCSYLEKFSREQSVHKGQTPPPQTFTIQRFATADSFLEAYSQNFHLVFLDIQMPGTDGMNAAQILRARDSNVSIVFITSLAQFAMQGYSVSALDYIVKPLDYPRFSTKMHRIMRSLPAVRALDQPSILISSAGKRHVLSAQDVYYVHVEDHHVTLSTSAGTLPVSSSLRSLQNDCERLGLVRISAKAMVNYRFVTRMDRTSVTVLQPGSSPSVTLPLSRARSSAARAQLTQLLASGGRTGGTV
ncbi:LytR/AlgR family response regulator transcription factor [Alloscardovia macacae]|uniref:DNA-binding response regulator n=1 Tax=Alloscardovia macacae TaxID=1160091 RepID=A0A261F6G1_9BIFI|nr:LytTR family DNA-binding domain-containing protein [Alloscardovia macacae]OZG54678.1 DNA-binding response regulator [Alloscardovia macacae]